MEPENFYQKKYYKKIICGYFPCIAILQSMGNNILYKNNKFILEKAKVLDIECEKSYEHFNKCRSIYPNNDIYWKNSEVSNNVYVFNTKEEAWKYF